MVLFFLENIAELTPLSDLFSLLVNEEVAVNKFRSFKIALDEAWKDTVTSPSVTVLRQERYITEQGFVILKVFAEVHFHPNSCIMFFIISPAILRCVIDILCCLYKLACLYFGYYLY